MYFSNQDSYVFQITYIFNQSANSATVTLQDASGMNAIIDPTGGSQCNWYYNL